MLLTIVLEIDNDYYFMERAPLNCTSKVRQKNLTFEVFLL